MSISTRKLELQIVLKAMLMLGHQAAYKKLAARELSG